MPRFLATWIILAALSTNVTLAVIQQNTVSKAFRKALADSIGHQWYARMEAHQNLKPGTTRVMVAIYRDGTICKLTVLSNTSDRHVARLIIDAIRHSTIPQPPPEVLKNDVFESEMKFTLYPKRSNQSMKPTSPLQNNFSELATTPCRGLSPSR